jgi:hypothetical protein
MSGMLDARDGPAGPAGSCRVLPVLPGPAGSCRVLPVLPGPAGPTGPTGSCRVLPGPFISGEHLCNSKNCEIRSKIIEN